MKQEQVLLTYTEYESVDSLGESDRTLVHEASAARNKAYAPYSDFKVGAALRLSDGRIVTGNNQENAAYPSGLCAERVALFAARAQFPDQSIVALAIVTQTPLGSLPASPCGSCRQVMVEFEANQPAPFRVIMVNERANAVVMERASDLLPMCFTCAQLK